MYECKYCGTKFDCKTCPHCGASADMAIKIEQDPIIEKQIAEEKKKSAVLNEIKNDGINKAWKKHRPQEKTVYYVLNAVAIVFVVLCLIAAFYIILKGKSAHSYTEFSSALKSFKILYWCSATLYAVLVYIVLVYRQIKIINWLINEKIDTTPLIAEKVKNNTQVKQYRFLRQVAYCSQNPQHKNSSFIISIPAAVSFFAFEFYIYFAFIDNKFIVAVCLALALDFACIAGMIFINYKINKWAKSLN